MPTSCTGAASEGEVYLASEPGSPEHLVGVWSAGPNNGANTGISATSRDGGATWTLTPVPGTGPCTGGPGDWIIDQWAAIGPDGTAYYASFAGHNPGVVDTPLNAQTLVAASPSGGEAWPAATIIDDNVYGVRGIISRTSITAATDVEGRAWAVWTRLVNPIFQGVFVARTDDGGATWDAPVEVIDVPLGAAAPTQLVQRPDGGLTLFYLELDTINSIRGGLLGQPAPALARAIRSQDAGKTWSAPVTVASLPANVLVRAAAAPDGSLYMVWDELRGETAVLRITRSTNGGFSWSEGIDIASFPAGPLSSRHVAPDVAIADTGSIGVSYYSGVAGGGRIARWFAHSTDQGATWTPQPISEPFAFDTGSGGTGDGPQGAYQGLAAIGEGFGALFVIGTGNEANPTEVVFVRIHP